MNCVKCKRPKTTKGKSYCTECKRAYDKEYYQDTRKVEAQRNRVSKRNAEVKAELLSWYRELKEKPCMDCNQSFHFSAMQFDHRPGLDKSNCIANLISSRTSKEVILKEIKKCDLVCSNCHAFRTWKRTNGLLA